MTLSKTYYLLSIALFGLFLPENKAQDPFFIHFYNNASHYNPAMVGYSGSLNINSKYKSQWASEDISALRSTHLSIEESMPCNFLDLGLVLNTDREGVGLFETMDLGAKFAGTISFLVGESINNIRLGGSLQWTNKSIDYNKLVFSDELDQKYGLNDRFGNDLKSSFVPPNDGQALTFFTPSLGAVYKGILGVNSPNIKQPHSLTIGLSLHNSFSLQQRLFGDIESILHNEARIPKHWTIFIQGEIIPYAKHNSYFLVKPLFVYQQQSELEYFELGTSVALNRKVELGVYYHFNKSSILPSVNTNWMSFTFEIGQLINNDRQRIDLGFAFTRNFSGLQNVFGSIYEFSLSYHFNRSLFCKTGGKKPLGCPLWELSSEHRKIYENIWYK